MELHPLIVDIKVSKEPQKHHWIIDGSGSLQIHHKEPQSRDANEYIMKTLAEVLHIPHSHVTIVHGVESDKKRIRIGGNVTRDELVKALDAIRTT